MVQLVSKSNPWNMITPIPKHWWQRPFGQWPRFFGPWPRGIFGPFPTTVRFRFVAKCPKYLRKLKDLRFIHFGRWIKVGSRQFPAPAGEPEVLKHNYLFFHSNYNGSWNSYFGSFVEAISMGIDLLWGASIGYPGATSLTPVKTYAWSNTYPTDYYYSAYPGASVRDIGAAFVVSDELQRFLDKNPDAAAFNAEYKKLVHRVAPHLSSTGSHAAPVHEDGQPGLF